jgi:hypothetical protein
MRSYIGFGLLLLGLAAVSFPRLATAEEAPCLADVKKFCAEVSPGAGGIQKCLKQHEAQLSEACRTRVDALLKEAGLTYAACREDIASFCSNVVPGAGRVVDCLNSNKDRLTSQCSTMLGSMEKK